ncbi:MAG: tetratricopeptide repeat protein [Candidatus Dadabacteria bacterium]|nr:tetratricopeptide repeat protein [Candidatus Dadabacteria bacterium]NIQ12990.1 tetratricopeptide repeat protein [Candidatus Dadabacteria bacterium]
MLKNRYIVIFIAIALFFISCASSSPNTPSSVKDWDKYVENQKSLAIAAFRRGNFKQALIDIEEAERRNRRDPEVHLIKGLIYYGLKDYPLAEKYYLKSLKINSDYNVANFNICGLYLKINEAEKAIAYCEKASSDPLYEDRDRALTNLGTAYLKKGDINRAKLYYDKALEINPQLVYTHNELGKMYLSLGNEVDAIREFKIAINGFPEYDEAYFNLGIAYLKQGNKPSACSSFNKVIQLTPTSKLGLDARSYMESICKYSINN